MKRITSLFLILIIASVTLLSGCSGDTSIAERRNDKSSTLYVGYVGSSFPTSFMPWLSRDGIAPTVASMVYNTLFSYSEESGEFEPLLGKNWCYVDLEGEPLTKDGSYEGENDYDKVEEYYSQRPEDYMVVRVELFDNIFWSDGKKMTVEDVYYSFDVATDNALSNHAGALAWTADLRHESKNGELVTQGMFTSEHPDLSGTYPIMSGEEDTVMYLLVNKVFGAVTTLFQTILILPEHIWKPLVNQNEQLNNKNPQGEFLEQFENPVGCGPWLLDGNETNSQMVTLVRNPNYHLKDPSGEMLYKVEKIKFLLYLSANTAIFAIRKGYIDILDSSISSNYAALMEKEEDIEVIRTEGTGINCLVLNINPTPPFDSGMKMLLDNVEFRKSIALAIDQEELIDKVLDGAGRKASPGLIMETNELLYEPKAGGDEESLESKISEANKILDSMFPNKDSEGYRLVDGSRISFQVLTAAGAQDLVAYLQKQLKRIGIELVFQASGSTPETTYLYRSNFDITTQGVILSLANADVMYRAHFVTTERSSNYGKYKDQEMTDLIEDMRHTLNRNKKIDLIKALQIKTAESYYKIPLYTADVLSVARTDRFTGYVAMAGSTAFNNESLKKLKQVA